MFCEFTPQHDSDGYYGFTLVVRQFLAKLSARGTTYVSFPDSYLSKY